jgi:hypothetical protein
MAKRPPKPQNRPPAPRFKKKGKEISPIDALHNLIDASADERQIKRVLNEMYRTRNDRGAAILLGTHLETALQEAVEGALYIRDWQRRRFFWRQWPVVILRK